MKCLLPLLLLTSACGLPPDTLKQAYHDDTVQPYLDVFEATYGVSTGQIEVQYTDDVFEKSGDEHVIGMCSTDDENIDRSIVYIRKSSWSSLSETSKQNLVFHELGHCAFFRDHNDAEYSDGCGKSIMNTYLPSDDCYHAHSAELIKELRYK